MRNDYPFLLVLPSTLMEEVRRISERDAISMSSFIRQSITRNLNAYAAYEIAVSNALSRPAHQRSPQ